MRTVACGVCEVLYPLAVPDPVQVQGYGCAIFQIFRKGKPLLLGCWGSKYDETLFQVHTKSLVRLGQDDPVCDACVERMVEASDVRRIPGSFLMVPSDYTPPSD